MRTDRRVDTAARAFRLAHRLVQRLAHAVQPLELERVAVARHVEDGRDGVRIVGRELRIDAVGHAEQLARIGDVGNVGVRLAREDRIAGESERLRPFDLGVPVGALDEAHHDPPIELTRQRVEPVDDEGSARAVGLDYHAEAVPAGKLGVGKHALDDIERKVEPVGLLGVDVQAHAGMARGERQRQQPLAHDRQHPVSLQDLVARMQRRELHRNAGVAADVGAGRAAVQRRDRVGIGVMVADRVGVGARRLAEHVIGIEIAFRRHRTAAAHRFLDGAAEHELLAHLAHGRRDGSADHRLAEPANHGAQRAFDAALDFVVQHLAGEHQRPGRGVDEDRAGALNAPTSRAARSCRGSGRRRSRHRARAAAPRQGTSAPRPPWSRGHRSRGTPPSAADRMSRAPRAPDRPRGRRCACARRRKALPARRGVSAPRLPTAGSWRACPRGWRRVRWS